MLLHGRPIRVVIDPGHGGADPGASGPAGTQESRIALCVARLLKLKLECLGILPWMTRTNDMAVELSARVDVAKIHQADLLVSLHCNASSDRDVSGIETIYHEGSARGKDLAETLQQTLRMGLPLSRSRGVKASPSPGYPRDLYVLRKSPCATALVELEFISHPGWEQWLNRVDSQDTLAELLKIGIRNYALKIGATEP